MFSVRGLRKSGEVRAVILEMRDNFVEQIGKDSRTIRPNQCPPMI